MTSPIGFISNSWADDWLKIIFNGDTSKILANVKIGLSSELPTDHNGTGLVVPPQAEYAPVTVPITSTYWQSLGVGSRKFANALDISYPAAVTAWANIQCYTLHSMTNVYLGYGLLTPIDVVAGTIFNLPPGTVVIEIPGTTL